MSRISRSSLTLIILSFNIASTLVLCSFTTMAISSSVETMEMEAQQSNLSNLGSTLLSALHESNNQQSPYVFSGQYASIRTQLDYSYHSYYSSERQLLQDSIIQAMMNSTVITDKNNDPSSNNERIIHCSTPAYSPWIVFTAGAMGAGKTHTIRNLNQKKLFPLEAFVTVDPDEIRRHLPEFAIYVEQSPATAGELTRKEAGYISEILTWAALDQGKNVLVDGSLRDHEWYIEHFAQLRGRYNGLNIAILHITASREDVIERAMRRGQNTGRIVPIETLELALEQVPSSVKKLAPLTNFFCEIHNGQVQSPPMSTKRSDSAKEFYKMNGISIVTPGITWESFQDQWKQHCTSLNKLTVKDHPLDESFTTSSSKSIDDETNTERSLSFSVLEEGNSIIIDQIEYPETKASPSKL